MEAQFVLMAATFILALAYVVKLVYRNIFHKKNGCTTGCNKCGADFSNIAKK